MTVVQDFDAWFASHGDTTLRVNYPLNHNSVIFDIGAYTGAWAEFMSKRYACNIYCFEPVNEFREETRKRLSANSKSHLFDYAVGDKDDQIPFKISGDGSSFARGFSENDKVITIQVKSMKTVLSELNISNVDLLKVNIEGAEYALFEHIIESGLQTSFVNMQVQFHLDRHDAEPRWQKISNELSKTHRLTYRYPFIWENWQLL